MTIELHPACRCVVAGEKRGMETQLKDLELKDGTLTFVAERQYQDNKMTVEYTLTIEGDKLKGKGASEFTGQKHEWEIKAQREKKDK